jgi:hypothetical protein
MATNRLVAVLRCAAIALCSTTPAFAAVTQWRVEDGGDGHHDDIVVTPPWTWLPGEPWGWSNRGWGVNPGEAGAKFIFRSSSRNDIDVRGGVASGGDVSFIVEWDAIPSPGTLGMLGVAGLAARRRRR